MTTVPILTPAPYDYTTEAGEGVRLMEGERRLLKTLASYGPLFDATAYGVPHTPLSEIYLDRLVSRGLVAATAVGPLRRLRFDITDRGRDVYAKLPASRLEPTITAGKPLIWEW